MTNVEALKNLYTALGGNAADVADAVTNVDVLNAIAGYLGGEGNATSISEAIENIVPVAPMGGGDIDTLIDRNITDIKSSVTIIGEYAFASCTQLETADFPNVTYVGVGAFYDCNFLRAVIIRAPQIPYIAHGKPTGQPEPFDGSSIVSNYGYIYVPDELVESYKNNTNGWDKYANRIKGISELPTE